VVSDADRATLTHWTVVDHQPALDARAAMAPAAGNNGQHFRRGVRQRYGPRVFRCHSTDAHTSRAVTKRISSRWRCTATPGGRFAQGTRRRPRSARGRGRRRRGAPSRSGPSWRGRQHDDNVRCRGLRFSYLDRRQRAFVRHAGASSFPLSEPAVARAVGRP
jgi:hypothetical protein